MRPMGAQGDSRPASIEEHESLIALDREGNFDFLVWVDRYVFDLLAERFMPQFEGLVAQRDAHECKSPVGLGYGY
jgi:hypothetical protein